MSASDSLSPAQFPGKADGSDADRDKADSYDGLGADSDESFGYSSADMADYQYARRGKSKTETAPETEVF